MHDEAIDDEVTITLSVRGEVVDTVKMPPFKQHPYAELHVFSLRMGHIFNKDRSKAIYDCMIRLERPKTPREEGKEDGSS